MNKLFTKVATLSIGLAMAIGVGVAVGSRENNIVSTEATSSVLFTIVFQTGGSGDNTAPAIQSSDYAALGNSNKAYKRDKGCHLGSSSAAGYQVVNFTSGYGQVKATSIRLIDALCVETNSKYQSNRKIRTTIEYTDETTSQFDDTLTTTKSNYPHDLNSNKVISKVTFASVTTSNGRVALGSFEIYTEQSTDPVISGVTLSGGPDSGANVAGNTTFELTPTVTTNPADDTTLDRTVDWSVLPLGAVLFNNQSTLNSASGTAVTIKAVNANAENVVITAKSHQTNTVSASTNSFNITKSYKVDTNTLVAKGNSPYDGGGASSKTVTFTSTMTYDGDAGAYAVNLSVSPSAGVTIASSITSSASGQDFDVVFTKTGTYTVTATPAEAPTKAANVEIEIKNVFIPGYEKVNSLNDIVPYKGRYVMYFVKNAETTASIGSFSSGYYSSVTYSDDDDFIPTTDVSTNSLHVFSFEDAVGGYYLKDITDNKYLKTTDANAGLSQNDSAANGGIWSISASDGVFKIYQNDIASRWLEYMSGSGGRVASYKGTQGTSLYLYKLVDNSPAYKLSEHDPYIGVLGERIISAVAINNPSATIVWSITKVSGTADTIATISSTSGNSTIVTGVANGVATLTATFTAQDSNSYPALSCTINVMELPDYVNIGVTTFTKQTTTPSGGWAGTYLIVDENSNKILDGSQVPVSSYKSVTITTSENIKTISATSEMLASSFTITASGDNYTIRSNSNNYIGNWTSNANGLNSSYTDEYKVTINSSGLVSALLQSGSSSSTELKAYQTYGQDGYGIKFYKTTTTTGTYPVYLYKANGNRTAITDALKTFYTNNKSNLVCVDTSKTEGSSTINWSALSAAYSALANQSDKDILTNMSAKAAEDNGNYLEAFMSRYDYCVAKLGYTDFMGREAAGTLSVAKLSGNISIFADASNGATIIIILASIVSLTAIGGYFLFKKKKQN